MVDISITISKREMLEILPTMKYDWHMALFALLIMTGGRISEVLYLKKRDIKEVNYEGSDYVEINLPNLKQRKNYVPQKIALISLDIDADLYKYVEDYVINKQPSDLLFQSHYVENQPISREYCWRLAKKYFKVGTHIAGRHSRVMLGAERGEKFLDIKEQLGWTKIDSGSAYIHKFGIRERALRMKGLKESNCV